MILYTPTKMFLRCIALEDTFFNKKYQMNKSNDNRLFINHLFIDNWFEGTGVGFGWFLSENHFQPIYISKVKKIYIEGLDGDLHN